MKIICILLIIIIFVFPLYAQQDVRIISDPPQKLLYDNDISTNSIEYFGWAEPDAATSDAIWKIMRITYATADASDDFTIEFADGDALYDNQWSNRANLTYK